jgi:hypothetical protein
MAKAKVKVVQDVEDPIPAEVIARSISEIAAGMKALNQTRLSRRAIVTLIHENSKVARSTVEIVLNNLESLEATWLKKA